MTDASARNDMELRPERHRRRLESAPRRLWLEGVRLPAVAPLGRAGLTGADARPPPGRGAAQSGDPRAGAAAALAARPAAARARGAGAASAPGVRAPSPRCVRAARV